MLQNSLFLVIQRCEPTSVRSERDDSTLYHSSTSHTITMFSSTAWYRMAGNSLRFVENASVRKKHKKTLSVLSRPSLLVDAIVRSKRR